MNTRVTVGQLVLAQLDLFHLEGLTLLKTARELHQLQQSAYTLGQLKFAEANLAVVKQLKHRMPHSWRKAYVEGT